MIKSSSRRLFLCFTAMKVNTLSGGNNMLKHSKVSFYFDPAHLNSLYNSHLFDGLFSNSFAPSVKLSWCNIYPSCCYVAEIQSSPQLNTLYNETPTIPLMEHSHSLFSILPFILQKLSNMKKTCLSPFEYPLSFPNNSFFEMEAAR
ncbi:hypothetical protein J2S17_004469 [Cytobacillus purgationiresistens]|uniref:Uncharacterized protein n=1 Tax=Cytobacillus purgationiresistens TaxID=863449 RepID=A0ABU0AMT3_9BACI|nr:hypothetical protein [Cytobacillus purgationiresistens]